MGMRWGNILSPFKKVREVKPESHVTINAGAYGGVPPRRFPTSVGNIFTELPVGNIPASGIAPRIAARPNSASMLESSDFYSQIPGVGRLVGLRIISFKRKSEEIHPAAVTDVEHVRNVHPTTARKVLQGDRAL